MIEVEYDQADRSPHHDQARSGEECVICETRYRLREYDFNLRIRGDMTFTYELTCPECGDTTLHTDSITNLVFIFRVKK